MNSHHSNNHRLQFEKTNFTLEKYLELVGLPGFSPSISLPALTTIVQHHLLAFNYQNTELYKLGKIPIPSRKVPSLEINALFRHMQKERGGYCFQHLELLHAVLTAIGFKLDRHLAKIILQPCWEMRTNQDQNSLKTHELLVVHFNEKHYIVDVGMANQSLRRPLELKEGEQVISGDLYRLSRIGNKWSLDTKTVKENDWFCLYQFHSSAVKFDAVAAAHSDLCLTEENREIRDNIRLVGKTKPEKREFAIWSNNNGPCVFKSIQANGGAQKTKLISSPDEFVEIAAKKFSAKL